MKRVAMGSPHLGAFKVAASRRNLPARFTRYDATTYKHTGFSPQIYRQFLQQLLT